MSVEVAEGQVCCPPITLAAPHHQVYGDKDTDGFYRGHLRGRTGLLPCNMVSEIRAEDEETLEQLLQQGFLPLSTPVDRIGTAALLSVGGHTDIYTDTHTQTSGHLEMSKMLFLCAVD